MTNVEVNDRLRIIRFVEPMAIASAFDGSDSAACRSSSSLSFVAARGSKTHESPRRIAICFAVSISAYASSFPLTVVWQLPHNGTPFVG